MDKKLIKSVNEQINKEYFSSYLYLGMAAYFEAKGLSGFAQWMKMQSLEEMVHTMKFFEYLNNRSCRVVLEAIDKPQTEYKSVMDVFQLTLVHEQSVTKSINDLYELAKSVNDHASQTFLQWFITEQVEEEKNVGDILAKLELVGDNHVGILMLDKDLSARVQPAAQL